MPEYRFTDFAINSTQKKKPTEDDKYTYIGLEHLDSGTLEVSRWGSDVAPIGEKLIMQKGDVLFGKRRAYQKKVGIAPFDGIFSAHGMVLRPREEVITKEYFPLFISSDYFLNEAIRISVGSLSPTVNWKDLKDLTFNIPTIEEQKRIAPIIWAAIEAKNSYKYLIQSIDNLVKSQFIEMSMLAKESRKLTEISRPKQWPTVATQHFTATGYPVYGANGQIGFYSEYNHEKPTILIACRGATCGSINVSVEKAYINGNAMCLDEVVKSVNLKYLEYALRTRDFSDVITGSAQPQITAASLEKVIVPLPSCEIQKQFELLVEQSDKSKLIIEDTKNLVRRILNVYRSRF